jgi:hypothetical protein
MSSGAKTKAIHPQNRSPPETCFGIIKDRQQSRLTKIKWFFMRTYDALVLPVFQHRNTSTLLVEQGGRHKFGKILAKMNNIA